MAQGVVGLWPCKRGQYKQRHAFLFISAETATGLALRPNKISLIQSAPVNSLTGSQTWQSQPHVSPIPPVVPCLGTDPKPSLPDPQMFFLMGLQLLVRATPAPVAARWPLPFQAQSSSMEKSSDDELEEFSKWDAQ